MKAGILEVATARGTMPVHVSTPLGEVVRAIDDAEVLADTDLLLTAIAPLDVVDCSSWACIGSASEVGSRRAASEFGMRLQAAAMMHPSGLVTDSNDSPHRRLGAVAAELYLGFAQHDRVTPVSAFPPLRRELEAHKVRHRIDVFRGAEHGYSMPGLPGYARHAAERSWSRTTESLDRTLPAPRGAET